MLLILLKYQQKLNFNEQISLNEERKEEGVLRMHVSAYVRVREQRVTDS